MILSIYIKYIISRYTIMLYVHENRKCALVRVIWDWRQHWLMEEHANDCLLNGKVVNVLDVLNKTNWLFSFQSKLSRTYGTQPILPCFLPAIPLLKVLPVRLHLFAVPLWVFIRVLIVIVETLLNRSWFNLGLKLLDPFNSGLNKLNKDIF